MMDKFVDALKESEENQKKTEVVELDPDTGYYIVDEDTFEAMLGKGLIDEVFRLRDLQQRKLFINEDITPLSVEEPIKHILQFNAEDRGKPISERKPILLYLTSNGGDVDSGFELISAIETSETPVYTINLGYQYSMGFLIGIAGDKRYTMPYSKFLLHDGSTYIYNSTGKAREQMKFQNRAEERLKEFILGRSKLTEEAYDEYNNRKTEWYMFADEAKELGFTDYIIGEDCDISDIV